MALPLLVLVLALLAGCDTVGIDLPPEPDAEGWTEMLSALNAVRATGATCGSVPMPPAPALIWDTRLELAAQRHSADMAEHEYFSHIGTDGTDTGDRAQRAGYHWRVIGENIARYQQSVDQVVDDWLESPGHCRQILDPSFQEVGVAEVGDHWTQVFGVPR